MAVRTLLNSCMAPAATLTESDFADAAKALGVEMEVIKAVTAVEDPKHDAINYQGRMTILFERHYFHRLSNKAHDKTNPDISSSGAGGYGKFREQYNKLTRAYGLNPTAALKSVSWGKFQLMGEKYKECGFDSVEEMVSTMMQSERSQLDAFVAFVSHKHNKRMLTALQTHSWADFAKRYNGPHYKDNDYDKNLEKAYNEELKKKAKATPAPPPASSPPTPSQNIPLRLP